MTLHLVHNANDDIGGDAEDPRRTLADASAVAKKLRGLVMSCREQPAAMAKLTLPDIAQAKVELAESRVRLARARRNIS